MSRVRVDELHELVGQELVGKMTAAGWAVDVAYDTEPGSVMVGAFRRAVANDFSATAGFYRTSFGKALPPLELTGTVGVSYHRAYRLWPAVSDTERSDATIELGDLLDVSDELIVTVTDSKDAVRAAEQLAGLVLEHALAWAQRYASFDALLEQSQADPECFESEIEEVPLLLAAAGRHDDARAALARYETSGREEVATRHYKRFSYQLTRWLDAGGVLPEPPGGPVGERRHFDNQAPTVADIRREQRAWREAVDAVRRAGRGKNRDELRELLAAELAGRGLTEPPLTIEMQLDGLQAATSPPLERVRLGFRGLKGLVNVVGSVRKVMTDSLPPTPQWLEPPARASYPVPTNHRDWVEVDVDPTAAAWLDRVLAGAPIRTNDTVNLDAWLRWDSEPPTADTRIALHIGDERVGHLDSATDVLFRPEMTAAARREELPVIRARVTQLRDPSRHLIEIAVPRQS